MGWALVKSSGFAADFYFDCAGNLPAKRLRGVLPDGGAHVRSHHFWEQPDLRFKGLAKLPAKFLQVHFQNGTPATFRRQREGADVGGSDALAGANVEGVASRAE